MQQVPQRYPRGYVFFLPLAFETEGYHTEDVGKLLYGFAKLRAAADRLEGSELKKRARNWADFWLNQFAIVHARYLARCILRRAAVCKDAASPPFTRGGVLRGCDCCDQVAAAAAGHR